MAEKASKHKIVTVESDRDRVRLRPGIYTTSTNADGVVHIIYEIVDNALDELTAHDSVGDETTLTYDTKSHVFSVEDNGGGIPHEGMLNATSVLSSSGKYANDDDSHFGQSSGINGYGQKLLTFLSEWAEFTSCQNGKSLTYRYEDGLLKDTKTSSTKSHGTFVTGLLSQKFLDVKGVDPEDIISRYEEKSYLFPQIKMNLVMQKDGKTTKEYHYKGKTIDDRVKMWKPDTSVVSVHDTRKVLVLENIDDESLTERKVIVDLAFGYKEAALDDDTGKYLISYANSVKTYDHGVHLDGFYAGIQKYFKENVIPKLRGKDKDLNILPTDMISGICVFLSVKIYNPSFQAQFKAKLSNPEVKRAVRDAVYDALCNEKPSVINPMIEFVKRVARGRMASKKTRKKDVSNAFSKDRLEKFKDIVYNLNTEDPELILVEGDSAADNAATARDPYNQAIYGIRRPKNIFDTPSDQVARIKSTFNDVLDICGLEPGKKCDPEKSTMSRILMLTDGDIDGDDIAISTVCLLAKHCKPLIDAGMVGRILPPAYSIPVGNGKHLYVRSQREFFDKITKQFVKKETISYQGNEMTKKELREFLERNFEYDTRLEKLSNRYCIDPKVMEYIAWHYHGKQEDQKKSYWMKVLKRYPGVQILIEGNMLVLDGDIKGSDYINLPLDEHFHKHVMRFKEFQKTNKSIDGYTISGENDKTLYDVMHAARKYIPDGVKRFKGLGELEPKEMTELCMNRKSRTVVIFKFDDFEKDMDKINVIMSTKAEYARARRDIMMNLRADDLDIDT